MDRALAKRRIPETRRLLVYENSADLDSALIALCMYLHLRSHYSVKVIRRADFADVVRNAVSHDFAYDFGLYGKHYVWETTLSPDGLLQRGNLNFSKTTIERYRAIYSSLWSIASDYPSRFYAKYSCNNRRNHQLGDFRSLVGSEED